LEPGFRILSQQRRVDTGVADFTGYDNQGKYTIIEVKRKTVDAKAVKQAYKYLSEFKSKGVSVRGIIAAPAISSEASRLAALLGLEFKKIDLSKCKVAHKQKTKNSLLEQT
ncbi:MAG: endonuclease NucS domain-containing protein, partial [Nitrososphaerales archaeon]